MSGKYLSLLVHFTWSTAHREPWIEPNIREDLYSIIGGIARKRKAKLLAAGAVYDHIHLYTSLPSKSALLTSSMRLRQTHRSGFTIHLRGCEDSPGRKVMALSV